jgi:hypothetical protein
MISDAIKRPSSSSVAVWGGARMSAGSALEAANIAISLASRHLLRYLLAQTDFCMGPTDHPPAGALRIATALPSACGVCLPQEPTLGAYTHPLDPHFLPASANNSHASHYPTRGYAHMLRDSNANEDF